MTDEARSDGQQSTWTPWFSGCLSILLAPLMAFLLAGPYVEWKEPWIAPAVEGTVVTPLAAEHPPPKAISFCVVLTASGQRVLIPHYSTMSGDAPAPGCKVHKQAHQASVTVDVPQQQSGTRTVAPYSYTWYPDPPVNALSAFLGLSFEFALMNCAVAAVLTVLSRRRKRSPPPLRR